MGVVGRNIMYARKDRDITQSQLGKLVGVDQRTISGWEKGKRDPSTESIRRIASVLGIPVEQLMQEKDSSKILAEDDSMYPDIRKGDEIIINPEVPVSDGDIVLVTLLEETPRTIIRRYYRTDSTVSLIPNNRAIKPLTVSIADIRLDGVVTELHRYLK